jgi:YgiT-type zinc finger domain-containing protein
MRFDRCEYCDGAVEARRVTLDLRRGARMYVFRNVPVGVCRECGERYYPGQVLEHLDEVIRAGVKSAATIRVPTFDYNTLINAPKPANTLGAAPRRSRRCLRSRTAKASV